MSPPKCDFGDFNGSFTYLLSSGYHQSVGPYTSNISDASDDIDRRGFRPSSGIRSEFYENYYAVSFPLRKVKKKNSCQSVQSVQSVCLSISLSVCLPVQSVYSSSLSVQSV